MKYALISVSDKRNLDVLVKGLDSAGYGIISTGGTFKKIQEIIKQEKLSSELKKAGEITGSPEMLDGRVKTLHPKIHGSILYRRDDEKHRKQAEENGLLDIDVVVINFYPFEEAVKQKKSEDEIIENIDIGGPTMLISAVKNHKFVTVVVRPKDYEAVAAELGNPSNELRKRLAVTAINALADYRGIIAIELSQMLSNRDTLRLSYKHGKKLGRYGENWHQEAWYYGKYIEQLAGPELGYNNFLDIDSAFNSIIDMKDEIIVSIVKHSNPCGYATGKTLLEALRKAWQGDDISAFGSIIAFSKKLDIETISFLENKFVEVVVVPDIDKDALEMLSKKKNLRVIRKDIMQSNEFGYKGLSGGMLVQTVDDRLYLGDLSTEEEIDGRKVGLVTKKEFRNKGLIEFSIMAVKHLKSNAIAVCYEYTPGQYMLLGMGCGQPNRLNSVKLAIDKAIFNLKKKFNDEEIKSILTSDRVVLSSDAFFPFSDGIELIAEHGLNIVQPGGSIRDKEVIAAADKFGLAMIFTGMRHFKH